MRISSETSLPADKARAPHPIRLLIGRAICWFTDPVHDARREACAQPTASPVPLPRHLNDAAVPAHLAMFKSRRRPPFFYDVPVRERLIGCLHRMTIDQAHELCIREFGVKRTPSRSAIHRFWRLLDADESLHPALKGRFEAAHRTRTFGKSAAGPDRQTERQS